MAHMGDPGRSAHNIHTHPGGELAKKALGEGQRLRYRGGRRSGVYGGAQRVGGGVST